MLVLLLVAIVVVLMLLLVVLLLVSVDTGAAAASPAPAPEPVLARVVHGDLKRCIALIKSIRVEVVGPRRVIGSDHKNEERDYTADAGRAETVV